MHVRHEAFVRVEGRVRADDDGVLLRQDPDNIDLPVRGHAQAAALADHLEQATAGMVVVLVFLEVLVQVVDALGQQSDLHLGGTGVALVNRVLGDDFSFGHFYFLHIFYKSPETEYCAWRCGKHSPRFKVFLFYHSVNAL